MSYMVPVSDDRALEFLAYPEVLERMCDEDINELLDAGLPERCVLLGATNGIDLQALAVIVPFRDGWAIHIYTRRRQRRDRPWLVPFTAAVVGEVLALAPAYTQVPVVYPEVMNFARRFGFERVDTEVGAYLKDGRRHDREVMKCQESSAEAVMRRMRLRFRPQPLIARSTSSETRSVRLAQT